MRRLLLVMLALACGEERAAPAHAVAIEPAQKVAVAPDGWAVAVASGQATSSAAVQRRLIPLPGRRLAAAAWEGRILLWQVP